MKLSQEEWGDLVGTSRESVNKQFRTWTKCGLIALEKGKVIIRDLDELEKLADCVAVVTGASGGIGRAVAQAFSEEGAAVAAHYWRSAAEAESV